ncbi:MAG TPA: hypothetical protein GX714_10265 [Chloroflexi bacterium]|jgi:hypothetical protein|nr:hypothetical protein [Chloroflexota bacterium]
MRPLRRARTVALFMRMTSMPVLYALAMLLLLVMGTITMTNNILFGTQQKLIVEALSRVVQAIP